MILQQSKQGPTSYEPVIQVNPGAYCKLNQPLIE